MLDEVFACEHDKIDHGILPSKLGIYRIKNSLKIISTLSTLIFKLIS